MVLVASGRECEVPQGNPGLLSREALKTTIAAVGPNQSHSDDHTCDRFAAIHRNDLGQWSPGDSCLFFDDTVVER